MNSLLTTIISFHQELRAARSQHKQLVRELSAYSSLSDRLEIEAIVARFPEEDTVAVRRILFSRAA